MLLHIAFKVGNLDSILNKFAKRGIGILQEDRFVGGGGLAYLDTKNMGGMILKIIQHPLNYDPKVGVKYL